MSKTAKNTYRVTLPDGQTVEKQSARVYTHAVAVVMNAAKENAGYAEQIAYYQESDAVLHADRIKGLQNKMAAERTWKVLHWCGSLDLAHKALAPVAGCDYYADACIVPV